MQHVHMNTSVNEITAFMHNLIFTCLMYLQYIKCIYTNFLSSFIMIYFGDNSINRLHPDVKMKSLRYYVGCKYSFLKKLDK